GDQDADLLRSGGPERLGPAGRARGGPGPPDQGPGGVRLHLGTQARRHVHRRVSLSRRRCARPGIQVRIEPSLRLRKEPRNMMTIRSTAVPALVATALTFGTAFAGDIVGKVKYAGTAPAPAKIQVTK